MTFPLQIAFRHMASSPALEARIRERAEEIERFFARILSCHVVVECRHPRRLQGNLFQVQVVLKVPGREIVAGRDSGADHAHEDPYVAVRDAFDAARRRLEDHAREGRGDVKLHAVPEHGRVVRLLPERDGGFIRSADGGEIYFHRNSVGNGGFDRLAVGDQVRFVAQERESTQNPQASTVMPLGKHRPLPVTAIRKDRPAGKSSMTGNPQPATAEEIVRILGPLDEAVLLRILETGASPSEVLEAFTWLSSDDQIGTELGHRPRGAGARVLEILECEEPEPDELR